MISKEEFCKKLRSLKRRMKKVGDETSRLTFCLENEGVDTYAPSEAENASTIRDAITCYVCYGEYSPEKRSLSLISI